MSGPFYAFWSGAGAVFGGFIPMLFVGGTLHRRHQCHVRGCYRIARRKIPGTTLVVCNKHHPRPLPHRKDYQ